MKPAISKWNAIAALLFLAQYSIAISQINGVIPGIISNWLSIGVIALFSVKLLQKKHPPKTTLILTLILATSAILTGSIFLYDGSRTAIFFLYTTISLISAPIVFHGAKITEKGYIAIFFIIIAIDIVFETTRSGGLSGSTNQLFPTRENLIVNVSPPGNTVHFGAITAGIFLIAVTCRTLMGKDGKSLKNIVKFFPIFLSYVVFFSQSRAVLLGVLAALLSALLVRQLNLSRGVQSVAIFWALLIALLGSIFLSETIGTLLSSKLGNSVLSTILNTDNTNSSSGFSAGRSWLWSYHWLLFQQSPFGAGIEAVRYLSVGDTTQLGRASASTESFITGILAAYGFAGFFLIAMMAGYFTYTAYKGDHVTSILFIYWVATGFAASIATPPSGFLFFIIVAVAKSLSTKDKTLGWTVRAR